MPLKHNSDDLSRFLKYLIKFFLIVKSFTKKQKVVFILLLAIMAVSGSIFFNKLYVAATEPSPARGGSITIGYIGGPTFINPVLASSKEVNKDLTNLIFAGLLKYSKDRDFEGDLADNVEVKEDGKTYEVRLKKGLKWHDGEPITADDIIFTIQVIQNPDYKSPLRPNWIGVDVEKKDDYTVLIKLQTPYAPFIERLTLKPIPKHIWENIQPEDFLLTAFNLRAIGSGPYKFKESHLDNIGKLKSIELETNSLYHNKKPFIRKIIATFFNSQEDLQNALNSKQVDVSQGFFAEEPSNIENKGYKRLSFYMPRYFALFFNPQKNKILGKKEIREAIAKSINKDEIINSVFKNRAIKVDSPVLPSFYGLKEPEKKYEYNPEEAKKILENAGFKIENGELVHIIEKPSVTFTRKLGVGSEGADVKFLQQCLAKDPSIYPEGEVTGYFGNKTKQAIIKFQEKFFDEILEPYGYKSGTGTTGSATRKKLNEFCKEEAEKEKIQLSIAIPEDDSISKVAELISKNLKENIGINTTIRSYKQAETYNELIGKRDYEMLIFGQSFVSNIPDPYPFWHSTQVVSPGLNIANYENKEVDKILQEIRTELDPSERKKMLEDFQEKILDDLPAVFLYNVPLEIYVSNKIKNVSEFNIYDSGQKLNDIANWYILEKRSFK